MKVSFLGLGIMGSRMAANLLKSGVELTVWNRTASAAKIPELEGAVVAETLQGAVAGAKVVFSMLSTPEAVAQCFYGETGALAAMEQGAIWIDCSTVNPSFSREAEQRAKSAGVRFIDAPVAGTMPHAANAQLTFFAGATSEELEPVQDYLQVMGVKVVPFGKRGQGSAYKMLVNIMLAQSMLVFSEAVHLGEALGIGRDFLLDIVPTLPVIAPFTKMKAAMIRADNYDVQFPLEWMLKDLHLATLTAYEAGRPLYLANLTKDVFASANQAGFGRLDFAAVHRYLAK